jgi:hypothetical protein
MELHFKRSNEHFAGSQVCSVNGNWEVEEDRNSYVFVHKLPQREQFLLSMKHPNAVYFKGRLCISVLMGRIEILGCTMSARTARRQIVYSPKGSSLLSIETCISSTPSSLDYDVMCEGLGDFGLELSKDIAVEILQRDCVVLLEAPWPSPLEGCLKSMPSFMHLFTFTGMKERNARERESSPFYKAEEVLKCVFELPNTSKHLKRLQKGPDWDATTNIIIRGKS